MNVIRDFNYRPSKVGMEFHESDAKIKLVLGPYGSGKTCMIMNDAKYYCLSQAPADDGVRYTSIGVIRGTYPELKSTTRKSIMEVFPAQFGSMLSGGFPILGHYHFPVGDGPYDYLEEGRPWKPGDGTFADVELTLQALASKDDIEKIKSANWTFAIINEATSVAEEVIAAVMGRVGRFPTPNQGGCSYAGILIDTNQPPKGHYLLDMIEHPEEKWAIFKQPPAAFKHVSPTGEVSYTINGEAENLENLGSGVNPDNWDELSDEQKHSILVGRGIEYYKSQIDILLHQGRYDMIDNLFCMMDVPIQDGKPVFDLFNKDDHVLSHDMEPIPYNTVIVGYDTSGIHPAVVFMQEQMGNWIVLDELYGEDQGMKSFLEQAFLKLVAEKFPTNDIIVSCDPANARDSYTGLSPSQHIMELGFKVSLPKTNDPKTRIRAVDDFLNKRAGGLKINPRCTLLISAMQGGYRFKRLRITGTVEPVYDGTPEKNRYSHIADALQYACLHIHRDDFTETKLQPIRQQLDRRRRVLRRIM